DLLCAFFPIASLSPEEQNEVEEIWKPNESFLGKKAHQIFDKIKESILSSLNLYKRRESKEWKYHWERAKFSNGLDGKWKDVIQIKESLSVVDKTIEVLKRKISGSRRRPKIDDHFELTLPAVTKNEMGWYRCVKHTEKTIHVASMYYVDVISNISSRLVFYSGENESKKIENGMQRTFKEFQLHSRGVPTEWSACSRCGPKGGETRRKIKCIVSPIDGVEIHEFANSRLSYMQIFGEIPCRSSLIPNKLRSELWKIEDVEEIAKCHVPCRNASMQTTRIIEEKNEFGRKAVADVLPRGEYRLNERLPPLRKAVQRNTIRAIEKDPYVLSCGLGEEGVQWKLNEIYISSTILALVYPDNRIFINAEHQLIIKYLTMDDDNTFYSCHTAEGEVIRTFSLTVNQNKQQREIIAYVNFGIRFGAFVLILIMVLSVVLNTSVQSEIYRRAASIQKFQQTQRNR
uniref:Ig-like domain-containing protein n=1 Tax=Parascaris univalens TaxID=6257 RepID=A0A915A5W3_PARUN